MRILLIRPPVARQTIGLKHIMICEPLELEYVAAGLNGHDVQILDLLVEKGLQKRLRTFRPQVVGTSSYITGVNEVIKLCRVVKNWNPACHTVVGGVHASRAPEDFCDNSVDCIVLGDGTHMISRLVQILDEGGDLKEMPGLAIPEAGILGKTAPQPYMPPPDSLPFPRRDLVAHLQKQYYYLFHQPVATIKTLWGCWYKCNFCFTWQITNGAVFARSPESIAEELEQIEAEDVYIVDDIFLIKPSRLKRLAGLIREKGICKNYLVYARADFVCSHEDIIREWAELGLKAVFIGLEASTDEELISMRKGCTVDANRKAISVLRKHGVDTYGSLIPQPEYTPDDWDRLWRFIDENDLYYVNISPLTPLPGTEVWEQTVSRLTVDRQAHPLFDLSHVLLPTRMALKDYYRSLLRVYVRTCLDIRRARRLSLRTMPAISSMKFWRLWWGAVQVYRQLRGAHRHHSRQELENAKDRGSLAAPGNTAVSPGPRSAGLGKAWKRW